MAKLFQASLTVLASIAVAVLVTAAVLPSHARGGAADEAPVVGIRPAVLVEYSGTASSDGSGTPTCPALTPRGSGTSCPYLSGLASRGGGVPDGEGKIDEGKTSACPYLSSLAARTGCPGLSTRTDASACPYLSGKARPDASPRVSSGDEPPRALTL
jgi:hypothetical protein